MLLLEIMEEEGNESRSIWLRNMATGDFQRLVTGGWGAFFSPDGEWIFYGHDDSLMKIRNGGGTPISLCSANSPGSGYCGQDDAIIFGSHDGLLRVPASGGTVESITALDEVRGELFHGWPRLLPDGSTILFTVYSSNNRFHTAVARLADNAGAKSHRYILEDSAFADYISTGHLVFGRDGRVMVIPFDAEEVQVLSPAISVVGAVQKYEGQGSKFAVGPRGALAYVPAEQKAHMNIPTLVSVDGTMRSLGLPAGIWADPAFSPDGERLMLAKWGLAQTIWMLELESGRLSRLTMGQETGYAPIWSPDGTWVYYLDQPADATEGQLVARRSDGSGAPQVIRTLPLYSYPTSISSDGRTIMLMRESDSQHDLLTLRLPHQLGDHLEPPLEPWLITEANERHAQFSADGRRVAYTSDESGRDEVYIHELSGEGGLWQVSDEGGNEPRWSRDGRRLYYRNGDRMMCVDIDTGPRFRAAPPRALFSGFFQDRGSVNDYDVDVEQERFVMLQPANPGARDAVEIVLGWTAELERLAPGGD
jgi:Tol biopolymer transport system component